MIRSIVSGLHRQKNSSHCVVFKLLNAPKKPPAAWARQRSTISKETPAAAERRLEGKVAIITGAASGIGEATARVFISHGARVIIADIKDEAGKNLAKELGSNAHYIHCDVANEEDVAQSVGLAVSTYGQLDIMFNNAGIGKSSKSTGTDNISDLNLADMHEIFKINVYGVAHGIKHAARVMKPQRKGCIICSSSLASIVSGIAPHSYNVSKHAVVGLTHTSAAELSAYGIRVNCISPAAVDTARTSSAAPSDPRHKVVGKLFTTDTCNIARKIMSPDVIAKAAMFLATDGDYISGQNLVIDGSFSVTGSLKLAALDE